MNINKTTRNIFASGLIAASMAGCAVNAGTVYRDGVNSADLSDHAALGKGSITGMDNSVPDPSESVTVIPDKYEPVIVLETDQITFRPVTDNETEPLPDIMIDEASFGEMSVKTILKAITWEANIALQIDPDVEDRNITFSSPSPMSMAEIVEILSQSGKFYYTYNDGALRVHGKRSFTVAVPKQGEALEIVTSTITSMGAEIISTDIAGSVLTFSATPLSYDNIEGYFKEVGASNDTIVFEAWVYEVSFNDEKNLGIDWNLLMTNGQQILSNGVNVTDIIENESAQVAGQILGQFGSNAGASGGFGLGLIAEEGGYATKVFLDFLKTQGNVKSLAKPTLTMLSGKEATFNVGGQIEYISEVRFDTNNNNAAGTTNETVTTSTLETGVEITVKGNYANGMIFSDVNFSAVNLVSFQNFETGTTKLLLPQTAERTLQTNLQARPGDLIILGGMLQENMAITDKMIPGTEIITKTAELGTSSELVIFLRPKVISFRPKGSIER